MAHPIQHVVVLMLENRSFDHLLGALDQRIAGLEGVQAALRYLADPAHANAARPGSPAMPFTGDASPSLDRKSLGESADFDPSHDFVDVKRQLGGNLSAPVMNGFVADAYDKYQSVFNPATLDRSISQVMRHFPADTTSAGAIPALHTLATQFTTCDRWFSSIPGPTWPNRIFALAGTTRGNLRMPQGLTGMGPLFRHYDLPTIFNRFHDAGLRTRIYSHDVSLTLLLTRTWSIPDLRSSADRFAQDVAQCKPEDFPEFVFIEPRYFKLPLADKPNDQHPPHDIGLGDQLIADVYGALRANEALWQQTLFVVLYDEHGGFFDHVPPPAAVPPDDQVAPLGPDGDLGFGFDRLGVRVPAVLASPWLAAGVDSTVYDHSSLLAFMCQRWGLAPLGARCAAALATNPFQGLFLPSPRLDTPAALPTRAVSTTRTLALDTTPPTTTSSRWPGWCSTWQTNWASPNPMPSAAPCCRTRPWRPIPCAARWTRSRSASTPRRTPRPWPPKASSRPRNPCRRPACRRHKIRRPRRPMRRRCACGWFTAGSMATSPPRPGGSGSGRTRSRPARARRAIRARWSTASRATTRCLTTIRSTPGR